MVFLDCFLHPATAFFLLGLLLVVPRGRVYPWLLLGPPVYALFLALRMKLGSYWVLPYVGQNLVLGRVDLLSLSFVTLFAMMALVSTIYSIHVMERAHHVASLFYMGASLGAVLAGDYWTLYIFWQFMTVSSAFLVWLSRKPQSARAGFRFMLMLLLSSVLLLAGIMLRQRVTGTFVFESADAHMMWHFDWLILAAFCINGAVVPLHAWLTDACPEATVPGGVFLSIFTTNTAIYAIVRCFAGLEALVYLGVAAALYGAFYAITADNMRRILLYLMVSQGGLILTGIGLDNNMGLDGAMALIHAHAFSNTLLFMATGALILTSKRETLSGIDGSAPGSLFVLVCTTVGALSMFGMPFLNGFAAIPMLIEATWRSSPFLAVAHGVSLAGGFMAVGLRLAYFAFRSSGPPTVNREKSLPLNMKAAMTVVLLCCLLQGIFPRLLYRLLPSPIAGTPFAPLKVLGAFLCLGLTCALFFPARSLLAPAPRRLPDFDLVYRLVGRGVILFVSRPLSWMDSIWTETYRTALIRSVRAVAGLVMWFDRRGIDGAVEGTARGFLRFGRISARMQTGRLQEMLAWMFLLSLGLFALVWFWG